MQARRQRLKNACDNFHVIFNSFNFNDGSLLNDDDLLIMKELGFPETQSLNYQNNDLTSKGIRILCEHYPNAIELEVSNNPVKDQGMQYIRTLTRLLRLKLRNTELTPLGMKCLSGVDMSFLVEVHLNQNYISHKGCQWIAQAKWPYLKSIYLTKCSIDNAGALHLSKAAWPELQFLYLMDNYITHCGLVHLKKAHWHHLRTFNIQNNYFPCWFAMLDFYPHYFDKNCNFSFKRRQNRMFMMAVSSRLPDYAPPKISLK